ncbi:hypothetical protein MNBD_GAMMA26-1384 [hydrothermal vent metagenome]|uniref:Peptidoglycan binding-like domain-containing protein n=1 Tax=hydrothermal vent metagenome TaxID=652676 RepID=A0A3B1B8A3_9ZZZZ
MIYKLNKITAAVGVSILALSGCTSNSTKISELEGEIQLKSKENQELQASLDTMQKQATKAELASTAPAARSVESAATKIDDLLPPNAKSGECYARVWVPASYQDESKDVLVSEKSDRVEIIPAQYSWENKEVLTKEASSRLETVPAVFKTEEETIKVREATRIWRVSLGKGAAPASQAIIAAAKNHNINLDTAEPGMCYHEHFIPAKYETKEQQVLVDEGSKRVAVNNAKYRWVEKKILVKEASFRMEKVPAVYDWAEEKIVDKPAHTIWKKGVGPIQRIDESTGEIMCLVEVPATYKVLRKRILVTDATTNKIDIPAEYKTVKVRELVTDASENTSDIPPKYKSVKVSNKVADVKFDWHEVHDTSHPATTRTGHQICLTETPTIYKTVKRRVVKVPATTRKIEVPAEYETVKVRKLTSKAQEKRILIPAVYKSVATKKLATEGHMKWRSILCQTNMTGTRISQIQQALKKAGYNPGPIDGVVGEQTMAAVNTFQKDKGLPVDKYLNTATLEALGVSTQ